ncbi:MAG: DNA polymerase III subunit beta [Patescibacteria group bacterium]
MKVICTQENLARGLQLVTHIASKNISLPILSNVLLRAEGGVVKLTTTNLEMGMVCQVRGKVEREGSFTVQAKTLSDYINLLPRENITIEVTSDSLKIGSKKARTVMKGLPAGEFPLIPSVEAVKKFTIPTTTLRDALASVSFAVSFDETRPEINGVYFHLNGNSLTLAATDSYRLAERKISLQSSIPDAQLIVPIRTIQELIRIVGDEDGSVEVVCGENQIQFSVGGAQLTSRLIEGQYPDYQQIIPREHRTRVELNAREFINTVKRASLFCKQGSNDVLLKMLPAGEVVVSANNVQVGESEAQQEATVTGAENSIVFNHRFLLDGLQNVGSEECAIEMNTPTTPGLLLPAKGEGYLYIIMPIKQ